MLTSNTVRRERQVLPKPLIYRERDLRALTSLSRKAREDAMNAGTFPRPIPLGPKARGWLVCEIEAWIEQRKAVRDAHVERGDSLMALPAPFSDARAVRQSLSVEELITALRMFDAQGDIHLAAMCADNSRGPLFLEVKGNFQWAAAWIAQHNADRRNIYWQPNRVRAGTASKASAEDIEAVRFFQVDIDPPKDGSPFDAAAAVDQLNALTVPPSFIIHSGGGVQAFWRLSEPISV